MKKYIKISLFFLVILLSLTAAGIWLPWKQWVEIKLAGVIESKGFTNVQVEITELGLSGATIKSLSVGDNPPMVTQDIIFTFELMDLFRKNPHAILESAHMNWGGGTISTNNVHLPLSGTEPIKVTLDVKRVSMDALMQALTSNRASASGVVSGVIPVTINPDGTIALHAGKLEAENAGIINLSPDAIPGDNAQVALVREVLKNLHYSHLSFKLDSGENNMLSALLSLEGNNPDAYNGRPVKLNVHLTGDVLDFIKQNMTNLTDPKQLLEQSTHEKP